MSYNFYISEMVILPLLKRLYREENSGGVCYIDSRYNVIKMWQESHIIIKNVISATFSCYNSHVYILKDLGEGIYVRTVKTRKSFLLF